MATKKKVAKKTPKKKAARKRKGYQTLSISIPMPKTANCPWPVVEP